MARPLSKVAPEWWDYTTLDPALMADVARLTVEDMARLSRPGFRVVMYDTLEEFYLAEALEYVAAWRQSTDDNPAGICGPIGPTEQLPLVARIVNDLGPGRSERAFLGHGRMGRRRRPARVGHAPAELRPGRHGTLLPADPARAADARRPFALPHGRSGGLLEDLRPGPLPGDAGRPRRGEALGLQRPAATPGAARRRASAGRPNTASSRPA